MGSPQQQAATAIANLLGRVGRFAVVVGIGGGIAQSSLYTGTRTLIGALLYVVLCISGGPSEYACFDSDP
jgi:hypothetical protein